MQIQLYCPICLANLARSGVKTFEGIEPIYSNVYELLNDGIYHTHCEKGHEGVVVLDNLNFELLFDLGINAIADGYYRDAVASITAALERYYEFFIKVAWRVQSLEFDKIDAAWKDISQQSERQLGAYVALYSFLFSELPTLLSNSQVGFRNEVIHKGIVPTKEKSIKYAELVLTIIRESLNKLKGKHNEVIQDVFQHYSPKYSGKDGEDILTINHPTIIRATDSFEEDDERNTNDINSLLKFVLKDRHIHKMRLTDDAKKLIDSDIHSASSAVIAENNSRVSQNEYQVVINPKATVLECLDNLSDCINKYNFILDFITENHPEVCHNDIMTIMMANNQVNANLYYLYLKARVLELLIDSHPDDISIKQQYAEAESALESYHKESSVFD